MRYGLGDHAHKEAEHVATDTTQSSTRTCTSTLGMHFVLFDNLWYFPGSFFIARRLAGYSVLGDDKVADLGFSHEWKQTRCLFRGHVSDAPRSRALHDGCEQKNVRYWL